jgi:hypothetical protein
MEKIPIGESDEKIMLFIQSFILKELHQVFISPRHVFLFFSFLIAFLT